MQRRRQRYVADCGRWNQYPVVAMGVPERSRLFEANIAKLKSTVLYQQGTMRLLSQPTDCLLQLRLAINATITEGRESMGRGEDELLPVLGHAERGLWAG